MSLRSLVNRGAYTALRATGIPRWRRRAASGAVVLCFHNIVPDEMGNRVGDRALHVGVSDFARYLEWLRRHYTIISIAELFRRMKNSQTLGGLAVLTFDDGYTGVLRHAVPLLRAAGTPFALFPVIRAADRPRPFWWDAHELSPGQRDRVLKDLKGDQELVTAELGAGAAVHADLMPASWEALRAVRGDDCTFGIHSVTHRAFAVLSAEELAWEVTESRRRLQEELGVDARLVAFPYGMGSPLAPAEIQRAGLDGSLSLFFGINHLGQSPYWVKRVAIPAGLRMSNFACWAAGLRLSGQDLRNLLLGNF